MKKTIPVAEITEDLKNGLPDAELMRKYGLSEMTLKQVFDRLLRAMTTRATHIHVEFEGHCS